MQSLPKVTAETLVNSSMEKVWKCWTEPQHIKKWNNIFGDWHTPEFHRSFYQAILNNFKTYIENSDNNK